METIKSVFAKIGEGWGWYTELIANNPNTAGVTIILIAVLGVIF
jgi:hypothetical protein